MEGGKEWSGEEGVISMWAETVVKELQVQRNLVESHNKYVEEKVVGLKSDVQSRIEDFKLIMRSLQADVVILKEVVL